MMQAAQNILIISCALVTHLCVAHWVGISDVNEEALYERGVPIAPHTASMISEKEVQKEQQLFVYVTPKNHLCITICAIYNL